MELSTEQLRFSETISLFVLDDTGVVFSEAAQEIYQLNTTATYIWCRLEDGAEPQELAEDLADTFGFDLGDAQSYLDETLAEWRALGWLGPSTRQDNRGDSAPAIRRSAIGIEDFRRQPYISERCYEVLGHRARVGLTEAELEDWVYPGLSHLEVTKDKGDGEGTVISVRLADGDYVIVENGDPRYHLTMGSLDESVEILRRLWQQPRQD